MNIFLDKGYIGCFEMIDADDGKKRLTEAVNTLRIAGHKHVIAPIDGDTWHKYRLVSKTMGEKPFPMEPQNPLWYNDVYQSVGFKPIKRYVSEIFTITDSITAKPDARIREFNKGDIDGELMRIYRLSVNGFQDNFLYSPISQGEFLSMYTPILPLLDSEFTLLAEVDGEAVGFLFAFVFENRLILKTMAVLPKFRRYGIGNGLFSQALANARRRGITTAIAALMSDDNNSRKLSSHYESRVIREYTLYQLEV